MSEEQSPWKEIKGLSREQKYGLALGAVVLVLFMTLLASSLAGYTLFQLDQCKDTTPSPSCHHPHHSLVVEDHVALCRCTP